MEEKATNEVVLENSSPEEVKEVTNETIDNLSNHDHKMIDNDIKYRGPLSYRGLRIIGWIGMAIMFISMILTMIVSIKSFLGIVDENQIMALSNTINVLSFFSSLPLPLFLIANFAIIIQSRDNYKKLIISYLRILLLIYIGFIIVYYHYVVVFIMRTQGCSFWQARELSIELFTDLGKQSGLVVNVFVDLFCCVLIMFFIDYKPKKYFQGKKIIIFRLLFLLPLLYEIGSAVLMGLLGMNAIFKDFKFSLPPEILPLIGKKPVGMILGFVLICLFIKVREKLYIKKGGTKEGYLLYSQTNRDSFRLSLFMAISFLIIAILDFTIVFVSLVVAMANGLVSDNFVDFLGVLEGFTIGKSICLVLVIPFIMLFSYSRRTKNNNIDKLLPFIGVALVVFSIIETLFFGLLF